MKYRFQDDQQPKETPEEKMVRVLAKMATTSSVLSKGKIRRELLITESYESYESIKARYADKLPEGVNPWNTQKTVDPKHQVPFRNAWDKMWHNSETLRKFTNNKPTE